MPEVLLLKNIQCPREWSSELVNPQRPGAKGLGECMCLLGWHTSSKGAGVAIRMPSKSDNGSPVIGLERPVLHQRPLKSLDRTPSQGPCKARALTKIPS